jgi:hypothetical protein
MTDINYEEHRRKDQERREQVEPFVKGAKDVARTRPRAQSEADFLRRIGTPEHRIGPVVSDEEWARLQDERGRANKQEDA